MATIGQQLLLPESDWKRYDNDTPLISYTGAWVYFTDSKIHNGALYYSDTAGDKISFCFKGTKLRLFDYAHSNRGDNTIIKIDGEEDSFSAKFTDNTPFVLVFEKTNLDNKIHYVEIISNGKRVALDCLDIDADGELIRYDYFENTHLDEPLRKYGIAHFDFEESSGSVVDKLGSGYVGTVSGATRVTGWNGEGNAMMFDGNDTVSFPKPLLNVYGTSFRTKFKINASNATGYLISTLYSYANQVGMTVQIINSGVFHVAWTYTKGNYIFIVNKEYPFVLDKWYDLIFSWNGKANSPVYVYLNDELIVKTIAKYDKPTSYSYNTFTIGSLTGASSGYFAGQVDELQIFDKVIHPSDFTQQRLAIKTTDNKTLTLPNRKGRVKEIPTAEEVDLINQGYTWREIDNAVDGGIDFTQTTTEYEIVSKTQTSLGNNKVFTIPLVNDFKTIKIENNF